MVYDATGRLLYVKLPNESKGYSTLRKRPNGSSTLWYTILWFIYHSMVDYPVNLWRTTQWTIYSMIDVVMDPLLYDTLWYKVQGVLSTMVDNPMGHLRNGGGRMCPLLYGSWLFGRQPIIYLLYNRLANRVSNQWRIRYWRSTLWQTISHPVYATRPNGPSTV